MSFGKYLAVRDSKQLEGKKNQLMSTADRMYPLLYQNTRAGTTIGNLMPD